jgi:predicted ATPase
MLGGNETEAGYQPSLVQGKAHKFVVLSGCSGAGKSSLLGELGRRGFPIYEELGRQVVKEQLYIGGDALPWGNVSQFVELTISRSIHHMVTAARRDRLSFSIVELSTKSAVWSNWVCRSRNTSRQQ